MCMHMFMYVCVHVYVYMGGVCGMLHHFAVLFRKVVGDYGFCPVGLELLDFAIWGSAPCVCGVGFRGGISGLGGLEGKQP